jgi:hypothetical protein
MCLVQFNRGEGNVVEQFLTDLLNNHIVDVAISCLGIAFIGMGLVEYYRLPDEKRSDTVRKSLIYYWIVLVICVGYLYLDIKNHPEFYTNIAVNGITIAATAVPSAIVGVLIERYFNKKKGSTD